MTKKLTLKDIKNENKKFDEKKKVMLSEEYYINIYPNFSPVKISEHIKEIVTDKEQAEKEGINFDEIPTYDWYLFKIVYKFTDLPIPNDIKSKVEAFNCIVKSKLFGKIIEAFPKESLQELDQAFLNFNENLKLIIKQNEINIAEK